MILARKSRVYFECKNLQNIVLINSSDSTPFAWLDETLFRIERTFMIKTW